MSLSTCERLHSSHDKGMQCLCVIPQFQYPSLCCCNMVNSIDVIPSCCPAHHVAAEIKVVRGNNASKTH